MPSSGKNIKAVINQKPLS